MKKSSQVLLGAGIALITAAALQWTVGNRFHQRAFGNRECGYDWKKFDRKYQHGPEKLVPEDGRHTPSFH